MSVGRMLRELDKAWQVLPALDKAGVLSKHITPVLCKLLF